MIDNTGIILVHHSEEELTLRCLKSLLEHCSLATIYIVDNSPDQALKEDSRFIKLNMDNKGYGAACNLGIKQALKDGCSDILILNNDTYVEQDICAVFKDYNQKFENQHILTCQINYPDNSIWYAGGFLSLFQMRAYHCLEKRPSGDVDFATGCVLWIPAELIDELKGFNETYFLYLEDAELGLRAKHLGIRTHYVSEAVVFHEVSATTGGKNAPLAIYYQNKNRIKLMRKYGHLKHWLIFIPFYTMGFIKRTIRFSIQRDVKKLKANWQALLDGISA